MVKPRGYEYRMTTESANQSGFPVETQLCRNCKAAIDTSTKPLQSKLSIFFHSAVYFIGWYTVIHCLYVLVNG